MVSSVILVTGASGFLGQHVVKHFDLYGKDLKEIRVLDLIPYQQKLDYKGKVPIRSFSGSITDKTLVNQACNGVDAVIHVASLVDTSMFPNEKALYEINVIGTETIVEACKLNNVPILVYCSSISVFVGREDVKDGTEKTVPIPHKLLFEKYGTTKLKAQEIALRANGDILRNGKELRSCAILPLPMYGELDRTFVYQYVRHLSGKFIFRVPRMGKMDAKVQLSYVGNVAMMFVNALEAMQRSEDIGGEYYYGADDTPVETVPQFLQPYLQGTASEMSTWYIPVWLATFILFLIYCVLVLVRPLKKVNTQLNLGGILFMNHTFYVTYDKAKTQLGYKPIYDVQTAIKLSNIYYSSLHK